LSRYGLPNVGDLIVGQKGKNEKGMTLTTWLPDRWTRPLSYFLYYLSHPSEALKLYESTEETLHMVLLSRLTVLYGSVRDERLYDLLILILIGDMDGLITMCLKPVFRPNRGRKWDLTNSKQKNKVNAFCAKFCAYNSWDTIHVYIPTVPEFVEETTYLIGDIGICAHFKATIQAQFDAGPKTFHRDIGKWLKDPEMLSSSLMQNLIDFN
jgi:hypothetical protein